MKVRTDDIMAASQIMLKISNSITIPDVVNQTLKQTRTIISYQGRAANKQQALLIYILSSKKDGFLVYANSSLYYLVCQTRSTGTLKTFLFP